MTPMVVSNTPLTGAGGSYAQIGALIQAFRPYSGETFLPQMTNVPAIPKLVRPGRTDEPPPMAIPENVFERGAEIFGALGHLPAGQTIDVQINSRDEVEPVDPDVENPAGLFHVMLPSGEE